MERKDNTGALFKNDKKGNDKAPDYKGKVMVSGEEMEIAAWVTQSKKGTTYMSVKVSEPWRPQERQAVVDDIGEGRRRVLPQDDFEDDLDSGIPF